SGRRTARAGLAASGTRARWRPSGTGSSGFQCLELNGFRRPVIGKPPPGAIKPRGLNPRAAGHRRKRQPAAGGSAMFTGIITDIGHVRAVRMQGDLRARIGCNYDMDGVEIGASIACDGVCLTVIAKGRDAGGSWFDVEVSAETIARTNIPANGWPEGKRLNLERALRLGDELGGHIVLGHVDGVAEVVGCEPEGDSLRVRFRAPGELARFIA